MAAVPATIVGAALGSRRTAASQGWISIGGHSHWSLRDSRTVRCCSPIVSSAVSGFVVSPAKTAPITVHVGETSFTMPFSPGTAKGLNEAINGLFQTFKERETATRPQRWKNMEFRETGEDGVFFEVFCNPNAYSNAFQAKVLITINDEKIKIASEGQLSALKADIDEYIAQHV